MPPGEAQEEGSGRAKDESGSGERSGKSREHLEEEKAGRPLALAARRTVT